jgi:hypothetical protein
VARFDWEWEEKFAFRSRKESWGWEVVMDNIPLLAKRGDLKVRLRRLRRRLFFFEGRYAMASRAFYEKYRQGEMGFSEEFGVWAEIFTEYLFWKRGRS